jgi:hypothetical protein
MDNCNTGITIPNLLPTEPCNGNYISTDCIASPNANSALDLPIGATQTQTNAAITAAILHKEEQIQSIITEINNTTSPIYSEKTKAEIDVLIASNGLVPGMLYKINGVHPTLYNDGTNSGTTIYLTALTNNTLSKEGYGEFWNPKYNQNVAGFGIWSNRNEWITSAISGIFNLNEGITADNGATGLLVGGIEFNMFIAVSGNWSTATSITGYDSNATANISNIIIKSYNIGDKVFWGGYSWTNINGNIGGSNGSIDLGSEWSKNAYSTINYNKVIDIIEYDYDNDWISRRYDVEGNNDIIDTKQDSLIRWSPSAISVFMFGNVFDSDTNSIGVKNNKVENSYCDNINFQGDIFGDNILIGKSSMGYSIYMEGSSITNNTLKGAVVIYNIIKNCIIDSNTIEKGSINSNYLLMSSINYNHLIHSSIYNNKLSENSEISYNILHGGINQSVISQNTLINSKILSNNFNNGSIESNIFNTCTIEVNFLYGIFALTPITNKQVRNLTVEVGSLINSNLSTAIIFYANYHRSVYTRPDGVNKIRYYNNSDVMVIANITD